ncbi:Tim44/TimA family putative adaptor protein [Limimaricola pyoseonensis]|uniref:Predicted lipid-binding transport protein, Tim44 family n=1 Tax=Limimaricola pyoseonensis TaxID=521013 RepID=A0A1G7EM14_9RHOB|nr:Tim44/TimA family putative adaptor protein [Limimaricola pyoseonensis]SDE64661.1 Predicted lipid-binding transport protein, Tim44 family [Limimaricola pyoseonensis]
MNSPIIQLLVLAGIAIFLILRLRGVLGTREGFEKPSLPRQAEKRRSRPEFEVIEGGPDRDITDHVPEGSDAARALTAMKAADKEFSLSDFLQGARGAYEMILMAFENGDLESVKPFLSDDVYEAFAEVVAARDREGLKVEATFVGLAEIGVREASFDRDSREAEIAVRFTGELTYVVRDREGQVVEGSPTEIKRQRDVWTFARVMGSDDPNWKLVATGE